MTDTSSNVQLESLVEDVAFIKSELSKLNKRLNEADTITLKILHVLKRSEETFNIRVARAQLDLFSGLTHSLEHSIEDYTKHLQAQQRGFEIQVVDGITVLENEETIQVTRVTEDTYDYSPAVKPNEVNNVGTEPFTKYFNENPDVFGDRNVILINVLAPRSPEVPVDVQA